LSEDNIDRIEPLPSTQYNNSTGREKSCQVLEEGPECILDQEEEEPSGLGELVEEQAQIDQQLLVDVPDNENLLVLLLLLSPEAYSRQVMPEGLLRYSIKTTKLSKLYPANK
jgi:hypothetical protein